MSTIKAGTEVVVERYFDDGHIEASVSTLAEDTPSFVHKPNFDTYYTYVSRLNMPVKDYIEQTLEA